MSAEQGRQCVKDADKKLKGNFLGMNKDPDGAVDDLNRACNNFKVAQCCASPCKMRVMPGGLPTRFVPVEQGI